MDNLCLLYNLRPHNIDFTCAFHVGVVGHRPHICMYAVCTCIEIYRCSLCTKNEPNYSQTRIPRYWDKQNGHCCVFVVLTAGMRQTALLINRSLSMEGLCSQGTRLNESPHQRNGPPAPLLHVRMCGPLILSAQ